MSLMWHVSSEMQGNSASLMAFMGKESFLRMARNEFDTHLTVAAEAEKKGWAKQADAHFRRALAIEEEFTRLQGIGVKV